MKKKMIQLENGKLDTAFLDQAVVKLRFSLFNLMIVFVVYYTIGVFDHMLELSIWLSSAFIIYTILRLLDTFKFSTEQERDKIRSHWIRINYMSLASNLFLGAINATIIVTGNVEPNAYYVTLACIGVLVGGTHQYFYDSKLYTKFAITAGILPIMALYTKGPVGWALGGVLTYFVVFLRANASIQNKYFWLSQNDSDFSNTVIDSIPSPLAIMDSEFNFERVNESLAKITEESPGNLKGKNLKNYIRKESNHEFFDFLNQFCKDKGKIVSEKELTLNLQGTYRHYFMVATRLADTEKILVVGLDLTQLRRAEADLANQKAMSLEASKLSSIGEMANSMAHEINNPLSIILGKTEQARRVIEMEDPKLDYLARSLEVISSNVQRISTIIIGLRTLSGGMDDDFYDTNLLEVIEKVRMLTQEKILSSGVQLKFQEPPKLGFFGNPAQISQVLMHLLSNSHEAIVNSEKPWIEVSFDETESHIEIYVTDSGAGIPIEIAEKMFNPFYTTKDIGKGMGLGLSVSKGIVESHHGEFFVDNACETTRFVIRLPKLVAVAA